MSTESRCSYVHDVSGDRFDDLSIDQWHCPHPADCGEYCQFHAPSTAGTTQQLIEVVERTDPVHNRFFGGSVESVVLDYESLGGESNHPLDLRETTIHGHVSCQNAVISQALVFDGATISGDVTLDGSTFDGKVSFTDASINALQCEEAVFRRRFDLGDAKIAGDVTCRLAAFKSWVDLHEATFSGSAHFRNARFQTGIYGKGVVFERSADFVNATFDKVGNFKDATFGRGCNFAYTHFDKSASFRRATFAGPIEFQPSQTTGKVAEHRRGFHGVGWFDHMSVGLNLRFHDVVIEGDLRLQNVVVEGELTIDPDATRMASTDNTQIIVDLAGSQLVDGTVVCPTRGSWRYDLTNATVGDVHFKGTDVFEWTHVQNTTFEGFDFSRDSHKQSLANRNWKLHSETDEQLPAALENTYLKAKNGATAGGATKVASEFFRKELLYRRKNHWRLLQQADAVRDKIRHAGRYVANGTLSTTTGYGERPSYVLGWSVGIVGSFAVLYMMLGDSLNGVESLLFSFQSFITFILGTPPVSNVSIQIISSIQGFLGAFFIALFVFTLTRSVHR